eukprot:Nitzschia sp. Nitz4//scaffold10_size219509//177264//178358//NITZ4_001455-RA/size219509-processed-gene-0.93-mRNA-1//1//CDS//3329533001//2634//frame0
MSGLDDSTDVNEVLESLVQLKLQPQVVKESRNRLQEEIDAIGFSIFESVEGHCFFNWTTPADTPCQDLRAISSLEEVTKYITGDESPDTLIDFSKINLPLDFLSLPPYEHKDKFPFGNFHVAKLFVAHRHFGIDFSDIDFVFGGSTLELLAHGDASGPYAATVIPGTKTIMVVKNKSYSRNLSDGGYQFERLVTGRKMSDASSDNTVTEHLHVMKVGSFRVLFSSECDAVMEDGTLVEIKASNPKYWGTKVMFQMISSASTKLCQGRKYRGSLTSVFKTPLRKVAYNAVASKSQLSCLELNILDRMKDLKAEFEDQTPGDDFEIYFSGNHLRLRPSSGAALLPQTNIVFDALGLGLSARRNAAV